ncbi:MAG: amidohydrolase [Bacteroidales bacterium]|jgi:hippurate hydrolase|nr:amidohydrolase [Bacteroidales bacterium]
MIENIIQSTIALRRKIHQNPELSGQEKQTSALVQRELTKYGIKFKAGYSGYGVVAIIKGRNPEKRLVALRADMDALPINEETGLQYASRNKGVMHACGHDVHTACLLGAARLLNESRSEWEGRVLLVFQPSEEKYGGGADVMLKEKALQAFSRKPPERMYALHVTPELDAGTLGFRARQYMAATDEIHITVRGKGGHAALINERTDSVAAAAKLIATLQKYVTQRSGKRSVLAFGRFIADGQTNIIPDTVEIAGTLRTFTKASRKTFHQAIYTTANKIAFKYGVGIDVRIDIGYPALFNNDKATSIARSIAASLVGEDKVVRLNLRTTAEDFAFFAEKIPSCFFRLGTGKSEGGLHSSKFTIDEKAIETGVRMMAELGMRG